MAVSSSIWSRASSCVRRRRASRWRNSLSGVWASACQSSRDVRRSPPCVRVTAASDFSHHGAPGTAAPLREGVGGLGVVPRPPVVHEPDVLVVLPAIRVVLHALLEQRDGLIGAAGTAGRLLGQEDRAEPVRDVEARIERGGQVEKRVQVLEPLGSVVPQPRRAEVLERAHPVQVGRQRVEAEDRAACDGRRLQVQHRGQVELGTLPQRQGLQSHGRRQEHGRSNEPRRTAGQGLARRRRFPVPGSRLPVT